MTACVSCQKMTTGPNKLINDLKNRWQWAWLNEKDNRGREWRDWCVMVDVPSCCFCIICNKTIKYGYSGKKSLWLHSEETSHVKCTQTLKKNTTLPGATVTVGQSSIADQVAELRCVTAAFSLFHVL